jgi:putative ABC transport system substrate-binding protein
LHQLVPKAVRIAVLVNPANPATTGAILRGIPDAARALGLQVQVVRASTDGEIQAAFVTLMREKAEALFVAPDAYFSSRDILTATLAMHYAIPSSYSNRPSVEAGGLMSYGGVSPTMQTMGDYTGRILKGAKPADLPVVQSTEFQFTVNLKTARTLGIEVPATLLAIADAVIE